ncbi:ferritin-like domain-containing protein [Amycolatopsis sp. NPDC051372]|uniref:ferritin-like domain-containing protein n=1 Tax=unclassified Amycolatopsis TaxID=2618356 RepID=UPI00343B054F
MIFVRPGEARDFESVAVHGKFHGTGRPVLHPHLDVASAEAGARLIEFAGAQPVLRANGRSLLGQTLDDQPESADAPPQAEGYRTIGQFYAAVRAGLKELREELGEEAVFSGDRKRQIGEMHLRSGGGSVITVHGLGSALAALSEIVEQGEGAARTQVWDGDRDVFHPERDEVAHFYRFQELKNGRRYAGGDTPRSGPTGEEIKVDLDGVLPMRRNPSTADFPEDSPIRRAQVEFDNTYCMLLYLVEDAFTGNPGGLGATVGVMFRLKAQAQALMKMPSGDGKTTAGPTFEYVPPEQRS